MAEEKHAMQQAALKHISRYYLPQNCKHILLERGGSVSMFSSMNRSSIRPFSSLFSDEDHNR